MRPKNGQVWPPERPRRGVLEVRSARVVKLCRSSRRGAKLEALEPPPGTPKQAWVFEASGLFLLTGVVENAHSLSWRASRRPETFLSNGPCVSSLLTSSQRDQVRSEGLRKGPRSVL